MPNSEFNDARTREFPRHPAEACSELGYTDERRVYELRVSRWLEATRRWFADGRRR